jgi:hypothetical protein
MFAALDKTIAETSLAARRQSAKPKRTARFERLATVRPGSARRGVPVPVEAAPAQPSRPVIAESTAAMDVERPVEVREMMVFASPRRLSPVRVALIFSIIVASVEAVFLVRGLRE